MKGIIKVRNFDSLKKLSLKRAKGKIKNNEYLDTELHRTMVCLEKVRLLTPELLWELAERRRFNFIETQKLRYVITFREKGSELYEEDMRKFVNMYGNSRLTVLNLPYTITIIPEYNKYIWGKMSQNEIN